MLLQFLYFSLKMLNATHTLTNSRIKYFTQNQIYFSAFFIFFLLSSYFPPQPLSTLKTIWQKSGCLYHRHHQNDGKIDRAN
jgi:hypothetical protein